MAKHIYIGIGPRPIHSQHIKVMESRGELDDWTLIDKYVDDPAYLKCDASKLPFEDNTIETVYNSHLLEHISYRLTIDTLREWYRVLKPGGKIIINVPDFIWACEKFLANYKNNEPTGSEYYRKYTDFWQIFLGSQEHDGEYHKAAFTDKTLKEALEHVGFKKVKVDCVYEAHDMGCLIAEGEK